MKKSDRMECLYMYMHGAVTLNWILKMCDWKSLASSDSGNGQIVGCGGDD